MKEDSEGFLYPEIDKDKCVECGLCKKVCTANNDVTHRETIITYAAKSADKNEHITSTSGGVASAFSRYVVENGGCVFGARFNEDLSVSHSKATDIDAVLAFKGSKYIQSVIGDTLTEVKSELENGRKVLFIGTPCQIAGLESVAKTFKNYDNLLTADIVCHGTPSYKMLRTHIEEIESKFGRKANKVAFREGEGYKFVLSDDDGAFYKGGNHQDEFFLGFFRNLFMRPSCYTCRYACPKRVSDITIGDFWGLGKEEPFNDSKENGISVCMVNTQKGKAFLDNCKDMLVLTERKTSEAVNGNKQLRFPSKRHEKRDKFFISLDKKGFNKSVNRILLKERIAYKLLDIKNGRK